MFVSNTHVVRGQLVRIDSLSFYRVDSRDQIQVVKLSALTSWAISLVPILCVCVFENRKMLLRATDTNA